MITNKKKIRKVCKCILANDFSELVKAVGVLTQDWGLVEVPEDLAFKDKETILELVLRVRNLFIFRALLGNKPMRLLSHRDIHGDDILKQAHKYSSIEIINEIKRTYKNHDCGFPDHSALLENNQVIGVLHSIRSNQSDLVKFCLLNDMDSFKECLTEESLLEVVKTNSGNMLVKDAILSSEFTKFRLEVVSFLDSKKLELNSIHNLLI